MGPSALGLLVFTFLLLIAHLFKMMDVLLNTGVGLREAGLYIACVLPTLLPVTVPMSLLLGVLLGFGRMASDSEIMAIRTSGVYMWRIFWPIIALCAIISVLMMWANVTLTPALNLRAEDTQLRILSQLATSMQPGRVHHEGLSEEFKQGAVYFKSRDADTGEMRDVALGLGNTGESSDGSKVGGASVFIVAPRGIMVTDIASASIRMELFDGTAHIMSEGLGGRGEPAEENVEGDTTDEPLDYSIGSFSKLTQVWEMDIGRRHHDGTFELKPEMMTRAQLTEAIGRDLPWGSNPKTKYRWVVERDQRFSMPLACVSVILLGIPLALRIRPSTNSLGFAVALALTFLYYVVLKWGVSVGMNGSPLGTPMIYLPNVLLGGAGLILMIRTLRQ